MPLDLLGRQEALEILELLAIRVLQVQQVVRGTLELVEHRGTGVHLGPLGQWVALGQLAPMVVWVPLGLVEQQVHQDSRAALEASEQLEWWARLAALATLDYLDWLDYLEQQAAQVTPVPLD